QEAAAWARQPAAHHGEPHYRAVAGRGDGQGIPHRVRRREVRRLRWMVRGRLRQNCRGMAIPIEKTRHAGASRRPVITLSGPLTTRIRRTGPDERGDAATVVVVGTGSLRVPFYADVHTAPGRAGSYRRSSRPGSSRAGRPKESLASQVTPHSL